MSILSTTCSTSREKLPGDRQDEAAQAAAQERAEEPQEQRESREELETLEKELETLQKELDQLQDQQLETKKLSELAELLETKIKLVHPFEYIALAELRGHWLPNVCALAGDDYGAGAAIL